MPITERHLPSALVPAAIIPIRTAVRHDRGEIARAPRARRSFTTLLARPRDLEQHAAAKLDSPCRAWRDPDSHRPASRGLAERTRAASAPRSTTACALPRWPLCSPRPCVRWFAAMHPPRAPRARARTQPSLGRPKPDPATAWGVGGRRSRFATSRLNAAPFAVRVPETDSPVMCAAVLLIAGTRLSSARNDATMPAASRESCDRARR